MNRELLWEGKPPRIATPKLIRGWYDGGIGLPDIRRYYWAAELAAINKCVYRPQDAPRYRMDGWLLPDANYSRALYSKPARSKLTGPTEHAVHIWHTVIKSMAWAGKITQVAPLWDAEIFGTLRNTKGFDRWDMIGISRVRDQWKKGGVIPFHAVTKRNLSWLRQKHSDTCR